jgi:hypothetical protein
MTEDRDRLVERVRQFALPGGPVECRGTWVRQKGEIRFGPDRPWLPFQAEQAFVGPGIDFRWRARVRIARLIGARVVDRFEGGVGALEAKVFGVIPIAFARGPATDTGEALRGLAELPWHPFTFGGGTALAFTSVSPDRLRGSFDDGRTRACVEFDVARDGSVTGVSTPSRPRLVGKEVVHNRWSGAFGEYRTFSGIRVPTAAEVTWHLPEGTFTYWKGRVTEFGLIR